MGWYLMLLQPAMVRTLLGGGEILGICHDVYALARCTPQHKPQDALWQMRVSVPMPYADDG